MSNKFPSYTSFRQHHGLSLGLFSLMGHDGPECNVYIYQPVTSVSAEKKKKKNPITSVSFKIFKGLCKKKNLLKCDFSGI